VHQCAEFANLRSEYLEMSLNINLYFKKMELSTGFQRQYRF